MPDEKTGRGGEEETGKREPLSALRDASLEKR